MLWLAFRMLFQERGRLVITLVGIVFSTVLTLVEVGIYLGMMGNATSVVRHTDADIWIVSQNVPNFDFSQPFPAYRINRVRALDEVFRVFKGRIEEIAEYVGKREIKPNNPAVNLGLKIIQVKIALPEATPLKLGMTVDVRIIPSDK